jgi:hypothetical protein
MKRILLILACGLHATLALAQWQDVKGEELRALYSDTTHLGTAPSFTAHYRAGGAGELIVPQGKFHRTWRLRGEDQVCFVQMDGSGWCVTVQKDANRPGAYRSRRTTDGQLTNFSVTEK